MIRAFGAALLAAAMAGCTTAAPQYFRDCPTCPELVVIKPGSFVMGSEAAETTAAGMREDRATAEQPTLPVTIDYRFAIGRYEVTIADFKAFVSETKFEAGKGCFAASGSSWKLEADADFAAPGFVVTDRHPAICLSVIEFQAYLDWMSSKTGHKYRFPSEAEWEYVARLGTGGVRIFTADSPDACQLFNGADKQFTETFDQEYFSFKCDDGYPVTAPIGTYQPNLLGMYDVFGNSAEVMGDCYVPSHEGAPTDGSALLTPDCGIRVAKGGSFAGEPPFFRAATRVSVTDPVRGTGFGLRVVREMPDKVR